MAGRKKKRHLSIKCPEVKAGEAADEKAGLGEKAGEKADEKAGLGEKAGEKAGVVKTNVWL